MKKFGVFLTVAVVIAAFGLIGCNNGTTDTQETVFSPGIAHVVDNKIIHENPAITISQHEQHDDSKVSINSETGAATLTGGAISYTFPTGLSLSWEECDEIQIEYTITNNSTPHGSMIIKKGVDSNTDIAGGGSGLTNNIYCWFDQGTALTFSTSQFTSTNGITIQYNDGDNSEAPITIKINKVTFTQFSGDEYELESFTVEGKNGAVVEEDGAVSLTSGAHLLTFQYPASLNDTYTKVTITFTVTAADDNDGDPLKGILKKGYDSFIDSSPATYPTFDEGENIITWNLSMFADPPATSGIGIQNNGGKYSILITKIVFTN